MKAYLDIIKEIVEEGESRPTRTGIKCITIPGMVFRHKMSEGFPLLTTKKMPFRLIASELEFFIKGITDKRWLQERNNHIWDEWCNPEIVPYGHDEETQKKMKEERDLGPVYGFQWRHFNAEYTTFDADYSGKGIDQLKNIVEKLKTDPSDRRMIVSAWNPSAKPKMALPPCHYSFQVIVINNKLNLIWNQRSIDSVLGLPFNIASYALLLHLLAKESGFEEGTLIGFLGDTHIYETHLEGVKEQLNRIPLKLPKIRTDNFKSIFEWKYTDSKIEDYKSHERIKFDIAV